MATTHHERSAIGTMYAGLGLTIVAMIVPYVDHAGGGYQLTSSTTRFCLWKERHEHSA